VNYLHRIADAHVAPNEHVEYYYELALADEQTPPQMNPSRIPASLDDPALRMSHPLLPMEPMSADDGYGARMYRQMLEDITTSPWDRTENDRLLVLSLLDQLPVAERTVIGQRLLTHLGQAPEVGIGETRWEARRYLLGTADIQLGFIVCNQFTDFHRQAFQQWAMLRHHEWTTLLDVDIQDAASTAAVMLTPRYDRVRPWDTTVLVIVGMLDLDPNELQAMQRVWNCDRE